MKAKKVEFENVSKKFSLHAKKSQKVLNLFSVRTKQTKEFIALNNISFEVYEGETIGLVGLNGSGKSTLSNILGGVIQPSEGKLEINGETSLIAISAGLNGSLSGVENIELKCLMHGLTKAKIKEITPSIIDFADIGDYIFQPVKDYSSGMKSRLGFAISVHTNPDILIIDEALSVGDSTFAQKCLNKMNEFKEEGKTIFFISHSAGQMKKFCDRVIWLHYGAVKEIGDATEVIDNYQKFTKWFNNLSNENKKKHKQEMLAKQLSLVDHKKSHVTEDRTSRLKILLKNGIVILPVLIFTTFMLLGF
ncbi:teichoic acids export ABC transporter ATP-binding subunit TagH [Virgibacillus dokdonensis]|uniref:Teichoic acids export ABC transporter ATP-binding subunit TagH n=1 Tax=Virgibacillus dokdonensis TaxID=302167 RepID=A0ABU7VJK9_9BACI